MCVYVYVCVPVYLGGGPQFQVSFLQEGLLQAIGLILFSYGDTLCIILN